MSEVLVGHVGVDSGQVWIGDPCYVMDDEFSMDGEPTGGDYDACCRVTLSNPGAGEAASGVVSSTTYGDGAYPVYVTFGADGRPTELRIVLDDTDPNVCDYCETDSCPSGACSCECDCSCEDDDDDDDEVTA
jgi:hypothetical protein